LDDIRSVHKEENSAAKCIALEHLGVIAARIRSGVLKYQSSTVDNTTLKPLDEVLHPTFSELADIPVVPRFLRTKISTHSTSSCPFTRILLRIYASVPQKIRLTMLAPYHPQIPNPKLTSIQSARELFAAQLGQGLASAVKQVDTWLTNPDVEDEVPMNRETVLEFGQKLKAALREIWKDHVTDVFDIG
jgi:cohesin loading factor subunit SCC2